MNSFLRFVIFDRDSWVPVHFLFDVVLVLMLVAVDWAELVGLAVLVGFKLRDDSLGVVLALLLLDDGCCPKSSCNFLVALSTACWVSLLRNLA